MFFFITSINIIIRQHFKNNVVSTLLICIQSTLFDLQGCFFTKSIFFILVLTENRLVKFNFVILIINFEVFNLIYFINLILYIATNHSICVGRKKKPSRKIEITCYYDAMLSSCIHIFI